MSSDDTPLVPGYLHGLRVWQATRVAGDWRLGALFRDELWESGPGAITTARCRAHESHAAPHPTCGCGLYALHPSREQCEAASSQAADASTAAGSSEWAVVGIVAAWGEVEVHADGFRAEHARPEVLLLPTAASRAYARMIGELAVAHGARVLDLRTGRELHQYCFDHALGLEPARVEDLLGDAVRAQRRRERLDRVKEAAASAAGLIGALLFNPVTLIVAIGLLVDLIDDGGTVSAGPRKQSSALTTVEQTLVDADGQAVYVALVRNDSRTRTALEVRPEGEFLDRSGETIGWPDDPGWVDNMPSLAPQQTGVVIDFIDEYDIGADDVAHMRIRLVARRMVRGAARSPVRVRQVRLDHTRCIATGSVRSSRRRLQAGLAAVARDRHGEIVKAGWWVAGPLRRGWSPQVLARVSPGLCVDRGVRLAAYPNLSAGELRRGR